MNSLRKVFWVLTAVVLATFAVPGAAVQPDKIFSVTATPAALPAGQITAVTVTVNNVSPKSGNSYINSLRVQIPAGVSVTFVSLQTVNGNSTSSNGTVNISGGTISVSNITGVKPAGKLLLNLSATVTGGTTCSLNAWTGSAFAGNSFNGDAFTPFPNPDSNVAPAYPGCDGVLNCGDTIGNLNPALDGTPDSGLERGTNTDGGACALIPYSFDFDPTENTANFIAVKGGQNPSAAYVLAWDPISIPAGGWTDVRPQVSWGTLNNPPVPNTSDYVPALACLSGDLNDPNSIMPIIPNVPPFDAASNPQPQYLYDGTKKAKMCIAEHGWASVGGGMIQFFDRVIDQSDGYIKLP